MGQSTHIPGARRSTSTWAPGPLQESPTHQAPPFAARCSRKSPGSCPTLSTRQAFQQEPSGKVFAETLPAPYREVLEDLLLPHLQTSLPSGVSWTLPGAGQDNRGYSGLHGGIFTALAGPHSWGTGGRDLRKTFLKLLLLRLWWLGPNLFGQAFRPRGMPYKCLLLQEALGGHCLSPLEGLVLGLWSATDLLSLPFSHFCSFLICRTWIIPPVRVKVPVGFCG